MNRLRELLRKRQGFTLIELMMVIAVIGILAAVLIPKIGSTKDSAKNSGVESNARQVEAQINGIIARYKNDSTKFQSKLIDAINSDGTATTADSGDIQNPFDTSKYGAGTGTDNAVQVTDTTAAPVDGTATAKGFVHVDVNESGNNVSDVVVTSYDHLGNILTKTTIKP